MRTTLAVVPALALAALVCLPAQASQPQGIAFTDPAGDANLLNDQGVGLPVPGRSTAPASVASDDILRVSVKTLYHSAGRNKTPYGISLTLTLADAPDTHTYYWIEAQVPEGCDRGKGDYVSIAYSATLGVPITVANCDSNDSPSAGRDLALGDAQVDPVKHTITWGIEATGFRRGGPVEAVVASTTVEVLGVFDKATSPLVYRYR